MTSSTAVPAPSRTRFLTAPFAARTWREFGYLWVMLLLAPFAFAYTIATIALSAALSWTVVGLFVAGALLLGSRGWGHMYRALGRTALGNDVPAPAGYVRPRGFWRTLGAPYGDIDSWRALLFMFVSLVVSIVTTVVSTTFLATALGAVTYGAWYGFLPLQAASDGTWHRGAQFGTDNFVDTPGRIAALAGAGLVLAWVWPWITHGFAMAFSGLTRGLLGPTATGKKLAELRSQRANTVKDADAQLRRIERDLHDGTQARLVTIAMQLGEARDLLAHDDPRQAQELVDVAHQSTKDALTELREIARGIHPPALDAGLSVALETLAARASLPVGVAVDDALQSPTLLSPPVQSIAYYSVAELLANVTKHAQASRADVLAEVVDGSAVRIRVSDDGRGGAAVKNDGSGQHTGLAGLTERAAAVDGTLLVSSPVGGPTIVTVTLPLDTPS